MKHPKRYTITAALPYTNGPIHIGHLAGVYIPSDIYARYQRLKEKEVLFICGSDEHGVAITMKARKQGLTAEEIVNKYHKIIHESLKNFGISFDYYGRTSSKIHFETATAFFKTLHDKNIFEETSSNQFFDLKAGEFLADRYIVGTCPYCGNQKAYGDQCEKCGRTLSPSELIDPKSMLSGAKPILKETKHWYLPLDRYQNFLEHWINEKAKIKWKSNVYGQVQSWLNEKLRPRAVTRDLNWGIPVPLPHAEGKVLYVWFDAPIGYISATKAWAKENGKDWQPYWQNPDTQLIHFIGKDNIVFHCIIFPAMLHAHGGFILPENVPANEFLNLEHQKISTSRNWAVWLDEYLTDFPEKQDALRYVLTANMPENKDNNFTWLDFQTKNNSELVGILGNFINRVVVLTHKYFSGRVPSDFEIKSDDLTLLDTLKTYPEKIGNHLENYAFRAALAEYMNIARLGNKYLAEQEPWKLIKENPRRVAAIIYNSLQISAALAQLGTPFLPFFADRLKKILSIEQLPWDRIAQETMLMPDHKIHPNDELLFEKIQDEDIDKQISKLKTMEPTENIVNEDHKKPNIPFDLFSQMDLRIGEIIKAQKIKGTDKLLELKVDLGKEIRTIVSGVAESFAAENLIGKQVLVLVNLEPRKIKGVESQGMLLFAEKENGLLSLVGPQDRLQSGSHVK